MSQSFATRAVHAGRSDFIELGVHAPPIDLSSTYPTPDLDAAAQGHRQPLQRRHPGPEDGFRGG